jgi:hypothetical protein
MRITRRQLRRLINEESRRVFSEQREELPDVREDRECEERGAGTHREATNLAFIISDGAPRRVKNLRVDLNLSHPPKDPCSYGMSFDLGEYSWILYVAKA